MKAVKLAVHQCVANLELGVAEDECMPQALCTTLLPQLTPEHSAAAREQLVALFAEVPLDQMELLHAYGVPPSVHEDLQQVAAEHSPELNLTDKLDGLLLTTCARWGIAILTHQPAVALRSLSAFAAVIMRQLVYIGYGHCRKDVGYLYGSNKGGNWVDGVLTLAVRRAVSSGVPTWIVLEGPISPMLLQPLHSLLDSRRTLHLPDGKSIHLTQNIKMIFLMDPQSASRLRAVDLVRVGRVNLMPLGELQISHKRKRSPLPAPVLEASDSKWSVFHDIDMCGEGDVEYVSGWQAQTTIEGLKWQAEQKGYSAIVVSSVLSHAVFKKFDFPLYPEHCRPISECCNCPVTIYIYNPSCGADGAAAAEGLSGDQSVQLPPGSQPAGDTPAPSAPTDDSNAASEGAPAECSTTFRKSKSRSLVRTSSEDLFWTNFVEMSPQDCEKLLNTQQGLASFCDDVGVGRGEPAVPEPIAAQPAADKQAAAESMLPNTAVPNVTQPAAPLLQQFVANTVLPNAAAALPNVTQTVSQPAAPLLQQFVGQNFHAGIGRLDVRVQPVVQTGNSRPQLTSPAMSNLWRTWGSVQGGVDQMVGKRVVMLQGKMRGRMASVEAAPKPGGEKYSLKIDGQPRRIPSHRKQFEIPERTCHYKHLIGK